MTELALNVLDVANNSTRAGAKLVTVSVCASSSEDRLSIRIADDGCGMDEEMLRRVCDPFSTTRSTRRVGMGVPLFKMAAEQSDGAFAILSAPGKGTTVDASFRLGHIDRAPLGDVAGSMAALIGGAPETDFVLEYAVDGRRFVFDTRQVKQALGETELTDPFVLSYIEDMIRENTETVNGGVSL